ncbi:hypothetical protein LTR84_000193 [Exophiala bonariae]|uniref:Aldehyde dehydrogenase domain-containing protein n=1 Tax=Exophiala bonariae TaxID=1690606 RepID=A0AAV9NQD1_9EURO|nr:hypothetical protein LTR84_000193 [Exophiala bonariae]
MAVNGTSTAQFDSTSTIPFWRDGQQQTSPLTFDVLSPLDNEFLYKASAADQEYVEAAIESARQAFPLWSSTRPAARRAIFLRAAELFRQRQSELKGYSFRETGQASDFHNFEYGATVDICESIAGLIQPASESASPVINDGSALLVKEPYGVVLAISPWNAPYVLGLRAVLTPLAMGNTVIFKGPEAAPATSWAIADVLHKAGLPAGCLNTIYHRPSDASIITSTLIAHPAIRKINFTGSTRVGGILGSLAGRYLKPVVLELGGKASAIICDDANIENAALQCAVGAFLHAGQICMSTERIIVNAKVVDSFRAAFKTATSKIYSEQGQGTSGQLFSSFSVQNNKKLIDDAISKGGSALYGDPTHVETSSTKMRPVALEFVDSSMDIYYKESFGPTVSVIVVDSDDEAVAVANDTEYGLSSAVFTEDLRRGLHIARQIQSGAVHINAMTVHDESMLPHGGFKNSGFGRFNGLDGLREWVQTKVITWKN